MTLEDYVNHSYLIPLMPLLGAIVAGFFGARWLKGNSHLPIWAGVGFSALYSIGMLVAALGNAHTAGDHRALGQGATWLNWIQAGRFQADAGAWVDPLTAVMLVVVCGIGFLITVFAAGYMKGEEGYWRFFSYLGLFIFAMTVDRKSTRLNSSHGYISYAVFCLIKHTTPHYNLFVTA